MKNEETGSVGVQRRMLSLVIFVVLKHNADSGRSFFGSFGILDCSFSFRASFIQGNVTELGIWV